MRDALTALAGLGGSGGDGLGISKRQRSTPMFECPVTLLDRAQRFGAEMRLMTQGTARDVSRLVQEHEWSKVNFDGPTTVDVGGR